MQCFEANSSPQRNSDGTLERTFFVLDVADDQQAANLIMATAEPTYQGRIRDLRPSLSALGPDSWEGSIKYSPLEEEEPPQNPNDPSDPLLGTLSFDYGTTTQHITTAIAQRRWPNNAPNMQRAIGVGRDGVEGVDIIVPTWQIILTRRPPAVAGGYFANMARLIGKVNATPYRIMGWIFGRLVFMTFRQGELLFLGPQQAGENHLAYRWDASENRTQIGIGDNLTVSDKKGHEYLWVKYKKSENQNALVEEPEAAYVSQVYENADFGSALGF